MNPFFQAASVALPSVGSRQHRYFPYRWPSDSSSSKFGISERRPSPDHHASKSAVMNVQQRECQKPYLSSTGCLQRQQAIVQVSIFRRWGKIHPFKRADSFASDAWSNLPSSLDKRDSCTSIYSVGLTEMQTLNGKHVLELFISNLQLHS